MPDIPPWITAAQPADYMARGVGLGLQAASQRAAQAHAAQQLAVEQQRAAVQAAQWQQEFQLQQAIQQEKSERAARQFEAMKKYQLAIQSGADPISAMLEYGPEMGQQGTAEAAALRSAMIAKKQPASWSEMTTPSGSKFMVSSQGGLMRIPPTPIPEQFTDATMNIGGVPIQGQRSSKTQRFFPLAIPGAQQPGYLSPAEKAELTQTRKELADLEASYGEFVTAGREPANKSGVVAKALPAARDRYKTLKARLNELLHKGQPGAVTGGSPGGGLRVLSIRQAAPSQPAAQGLVADEDYAAGEEE